MRAYGRIIKLARTVADLKGKPNIELADMADAVQFRIIDSKYWGAGDDITR